MAPGAVAANTTATATKTAAGPAGPILRLQPQDRIRHDGAAIAMIYRNLGTAAAEQMVSRALGELGLLMADLSDQVRLCDLAPVARQLKKVQAMADGLGMQSLAQVADDARALLERGDGTGFAAVWARLLRITERSLCLDTDSPGPG